MDHPYKEAPPQAFWRKAVSSGFSVTDLASATPMLRTGDRVASAGSCFAANIVPYIEAAGFEYIRSECVPYTFGDLRNDNFSYSKFSAAYGNIYTARQAAQLLERALGHFKPIEDRWALTENIIVDPFRPGLRWPASSEAEFDCLTQAHLRSVLGVFRDANCFVFTLGLTEAWVSREDGAVFPACPGTIAGTFNPERHEFKNFSVAEVTSDLHNFIGLARKVNPHLKFIITVSPVPLVATATKDHVLIATTYSKAVLRVAASEITKSHADVWYFPAYEIVTGPQAAAGSFEDDHREPSQQAIENVMRCFLSNCEVDYRVETSKQDPALNNAQNATAGDMPVETARQNGLHNLALAISEAFCEEAAAEI